MAGLETAFWTVDATTPALVRLNNGLQSAYAVNRPGGDLNHWNHRLAGIVPVLQRPNIVSELSDPVRSRIVCEVRTAAPVELLSVRKNLQPVSLPSRLIEETTNG
jgi:hypothetical protein